MKRILPALLAALVPALALAQGVSGKLVLYTSQPNTDAQQTIDAFKAKHPKVDITFVRDGTPRILAKLRAEIEAGAAAGRRAADRRRVTMEGLKKEGRLLAHEKADVVGLSGRHARSAEVLVRHQADHHRHRLQHQGAVQAARPGPISPSPRPRARSSMPSPLTSGAALIHAATLTGNLEGGWGYYEELKDNGAVAGGGNGDVLKQVAGGEKLYGMIVDFMPIREKAKGAPVEFVFPKEGVSAVSEPVAILKTTKNPDAAQRLRRLPAVEGGPGARAEAGLHRRPTRPSRCRPATRRASDQGDGLRRRQGAGRRDQEQGGFADIFGQ